MVTTTPMIVFLRVELMLSFSSDIVFFLKVY
jgi:hypothetical protein